jgi:hypothetical protein
MGEVNLVNTPRKMLQKVKQSLFKNFLAKANELGN